MKARTLDVLRTLHPAHIKDDGICFVTRLGHRSRLKCTRTMMVLRKEDEPIDLETARCEACGLGISILEEERAIAERSPSGVLRYRKLGEGDVPEGPWRYVPIGDAEIATK